MSEYVGLTSFAVVKLFSLTSQSAVESRWNDGKDYSDHP